MDALESGLDLLGVRAADDEDFLHACEREAFKRPVEQRRVAYRQETLRARIALDKWCGSARAERAYAWFRGRERLEAGVEAVGEDHGL